MENTKVTPNNSTEPDSKRKKEEFENIVKYYLESKPHLVIDRKVNELEIRFGTNPKLSRPISKIDYDNVVKQLYACGFKPENINGTQILRIYSEYTDTRTGITKMSNIRAEITGSDLIQEYCRTNSLQKVIDMPSTVFNKLKFTKKSTAMKKNGELMTPIKKLDMDDFNFRVSYQTEEDFNIQSNIARNIISKWMDSKKTFRCMNRVRFYHSDMPIFADLSIVKNSKKTNKIPIPQYTIQEAGVFGNAEMYEIELEVDNSKVGTSSNFDTPVKLLDCIKKSIRTVLSGLQGSKYPISYVERNVILQSYMKLIHGDDYKPVSRILPKDFVGPSSFTLQMENIQPENDVVGLPNIRNNYTVTEKADGERKLLYISEQGKIYLIDTNMNVIFVGAKTNEKTIYESLLDGEHIKYDKNGNFINLYAAFDVYYINKKSVRDLVFIPTNNTEIETKFRLPLLNELIELVKPISILETKGEVSNNKANIPVNFRIQCKSFEVANENNSIFDGCAKILSKLKDDTFEYTTDGLIFTPSNLAVGGMKIGGMAGPLYKSTWDYSFKWKPAEFNTIDFLVTIKKDKTGKDEIHHIFQDGKSMEGVQNLIQYKTLILRCGFDERKHGFINPCQYILNDDLPSPDDIDNEETYKPVPFQPTDPYDPDACFCNVVLKEDGSNILMMTEEGEYFEEDTIVEFKYVETNKDGWKWVPLRVRYDKTAELRAGLKNYGNAYHVANNNWHSIHNAITDEMITTGEGIPEFVTTEDVYYKRTSNETSTRSLRDFHNLFVKKNLITGVATRGDTLIDYAVGKAGDLSKWIRSKLSFVFGIDISKDNIHNQIDGACSRFLRERKTNKYMPKALFVTGDSGLNIRNGQAFNTEKDKQITKAVFGNGPKDESLLGRGVYNQYGIGENGFQISSCQFAMHYFFENETKLHEFLRNISECTKVQGYFIGTCYDGKTVFNRLKSKINGESMSIMKDDKKIYEITKMYDQTGFPDDEMSLGYSINVYQESINQTFREYLVNFDYFIRIMEDYGFILISKEDANHMNMPNSSGLFSELFSSMEMEIKQNPRRKADYGTAIYMTPEEKQISFMNRYFVFKKVRNIDVKKMAEVIFKQKELLEKEGEENITEKESNAEKIVESIIIPMNAKPVKIRKQKIPLKKFVPISETNIDST
jgi:hypothetical protein